MHGAMKETTHDQAYEIHSEVGQLDDAIEANDWRPHPNGEAYRASLLNCGRGVLAERTSNGEFRLLQDAGRPPVRQVVTGDLH